MYLETKEERFRSELDLAISVCWAFSVCQVSRLGQEKYVRNYWLFEIT